MSYREMCSAVLSQFPPFPLLRRHAGTVGILIVGWMLSAILPLTFPSLTWAEGTLWERLRGDPAMLPDRFMIRGGGAYIFGADTTITLNGPITGIGTSIDYDQTLGGDTESSAFRVDARYRFNPQHNLAFTWYRVTRSGDKTVDQQLEVDDLLIQAGAQVNSSLNISLYRAMYNWSFYHTEDVELALSPGIYIAKIDTMLNANATISAGDQNMTVTPGSTSSTLTAPLPSIGGYVNYYITPRLHAEVRTDVFWVQVSNFTGSMLEFYAGMEYRLFEHLALGAAYDRLDVNVKIDDNSGFGTIDNSWNLLYGFGTLYF